MENEMDFDEKAATSEPEPASVPRLSILHLLIWTTFCAALMALWRPGLRYSPEMWWYLNTVATVLKGLIYSGVLTGAGVLVYARIRSKNQLASEPGHWLLLVAGGEFAINPLPVVAPWLMVPLVVSGDVHRLIKIAITFVVASVYVVAFFRTPAKRWKTMFAGLAAIRAAPTVILSAQWLILGEMGYEHPVRLPLLGWWQITMLADILLCIWIVYAAIHDVVLGQRRDWLHWLGVATYLVGVGTTIYLFFYILKLVLSSI